MIEPKIFIEKVKNAFKVDRYKKTKYVPYIINNNLSFLSTLDLIDDKFEYSKELLSLLKIRELVTSKEYLFYRNSKSNKSEGDLFDGVIKEFEDLFLCIVNGYYSVDDKSWLNNMANFFDAMRVIIDDIMEAIHQQDVEFSSLEDAFIFCSHNNYLHRFIMTANKLELHSQNYVSLAKTYTGFTLNIKKICEEQAFRYIFFQNHLKREYKQEDQKKIQELLDKESLEYNSNMNQKDLLYKELRNHLKQLQSKSHIEVSPLLQKFNQAASNYNLERIKLYFYYLNGREKNTLFQNALLHKSFLIIFELLTENPSFYKLLNQSQKISLTREALFSEHPVVIYVLVNEGHLNNLDKLEIRYIIENLDQYRFTEDSIKKLRNWLSWRIKGYLKFRGRYIDLSDVLILQEIEQDFNIKLIWTPINIVISDHRFGINDDRRVNRINIGTRTGFGQDLIDEKINKFKFLEKLI